MNFFYTVLLLSSMQLVKNVEAQKGKGKAKQTTSATTTRTYWTTAPPRTTTTTTTSTTTTVPLGCMNKKACNFDPEAEADDESCRFAPDKNHDCSGKCTAKVDNCGICGGKGMGNDKAECLNTKLFGDDHCDDGNNN